MVRLAANLSFLFQEVPFPERFSAAARAGFKAVEFLFPYDVPPDNIADAAAVASVEIVLFNAPPGDWAAGDRGLAALPDRQDECRRGTERALLYARALRCPLVHVMAGVLPAGADQDEARRCYVDHLRWAADQAASAGCTIVIEPLNSRDVPGYFLRTTDQAIEILDAVDRPNIGLQFDLYHTQISEGDLTARLHRLRHRIRHVQIAGVPDRHEPDVGELNPPHLLRTLDAIGYGGWVGCEYRPMSRTNAGLAWARPYLQSEAVTSAGLP